MRGVPHSEYGGCMPNTRNPNADTPSSALPIPIVIRTMAEGMLAGKIWRKIITLFETPEIVADLT